ncbi:hypothetical protein Plhal304r1_c026g0088221 [Plasmopara halstedii]
MDQARPYELPRAKFDMVIATGRTFAKTPLQRIMASLAGSNHENEILEDLYRRHEIGQVSKFPGGNLRVKVKSKEACLKLERTKVIILGGIFQFKEYDVLANKNYLDISNVDSDTNTDVILLRLFILGCQPIYDTFREVNMATGITSATWRVYFLPKSCPPQLMANGSVCDQILFDNKLHPAHGKNAPYQSERLPYGFRSHHGIDLLTSDDIFPANTPSATLTATTQPTQAPEKLPHTLKSFAATKRPALSKTRTQGASGRVKTSLQQAVGEIKKRDAKLTENPDDTLSISTFIGSNGNLSPPGSPEITSATSPRVLLTNGSTADGFTVVSNKKKRSSKDIDFTALLTSPVLQPLVGIATSNYFQSLQSMEVEFELKDIMTDKKHGVRKQIMPVNVQRPKSVETSTESAFFIEKHHTKIVKAVKATSITEVTESMLNDENTALLNLLPDRVLAADAKVGGIVKIIENATNPDNTVKKLVESPLAFNSALSLKMASQSNGIAELAQLHVINRVLCATNPADDTTFANKWKKTMGLAVPSKRADVFAACSAWWTHSDAIAELSRATKALGMFEMALMATAPMLFKNDHWIQYFTGRPVEWTPAHHTRILHPNTLLMLLRSDIGTHCMTQWCEVQWQGHLLDDLEALRALEGFYPENTSVLKTCVADDGSVTTVASALATRC